MPARPDARLVLFEGTATLQCGGRLEAVLGSRQQSLLRRLDSRTADATGEEDKRRIFAAIESLPGGHAALDAKLQTALRRWLAGAAEGAVDRKIRTARRSAARPWRSSSRRSAQRRRSGSACRSTQTARSAPPHGQCSRVSSSRRARAPGRPRAGGVGSGESGTGAARSARSGASGGRSF